MVRKLRYRQAISYVNKEARKGAYKKLELAMHERNIYPNKRWKSLHVLSQTGTYRDNVNAYQMLMKDGDPTPTIPQARVMHTALGTWDRSVTWSRWTFPCGHVENQIHFEKLREKGTLMYYIFPKAMYKNFYPLTKGAKVLGGNQ